MAFDFEAERDCRRRSVKYATTRHVAREKSCVLAFLFPHSLLFCVHGMLAHQLHNGWLQQMNSQLMMPRNSNSSLLHIQLAAGRVA